MANRIHPTAVAGTGPAARRGVPPSTITPGNPARVIGVNQVGLVR